VPHRPLSEYTTARNDCAKHDRDYRRIDIAIVLAVYRSAAWRMQVLREVSFECIPKPLPQYFLYFCHPWRALEKLYERTVKDYSEMFGLAKRAISQRQRNLALVRDRKTAAVVVDAALA